MLNMIASLGLEIVDYSDIFEYRAEVRRS